ncbi:hypothetical protein R3P38DRAFT_3236594 [Favolaschia claudopus]
MLALNAAERAIFPATPILQQAEVVLERLRVFSGFANRIMDRIADSDEASGNQDDGSTDSESVVSSQPSLPPPFTQLAQFAAFTFSSSVPEANPLKRPKGHPDAPTPAASPEKKRIRDPSPERAPAPQLNFTEAMQPDSSVPGEPGAEEPSDVFGAVRAIDIEQGKANDSKEKREIQQSKLKSSFRVATKGEKEAMFSRNAELYNNTREERQARELREQQAALLRKQASNRERQQIHREKVRVQRVAEGWEPAPRGRKRVRFRKVSSSQH